MATGNKVALSVDFSPVKIGLALVFLMILMNIFLGILFGVHEDYFQNYIHAGIAAHPSLFTDPAKDQDIIWRWVERAHFHAGGIAAFVLGMITITALTDMSNRRKQVTSILMGLSFFYPMAWFAMFFYAPQIGRAAAHHALLVEICVKIGVGGLGLGMLSLLLWLFLPGKKS
ncbi:hypothetical protein SJI19_16285 [Acerihabitans sp. TG2]|uniref:hypothetical protein n=1 Tax=Acerihabitans sp. TG2 TaxID=3096008 RepID=UPI002B2349EC|nr:hypothetical protein [Acerihabitans sp. TG2]MEA9392084.1 hypothetical protein [Acerihabitans sp. TG2]